MLRQKTLFIVGAGGSKEFGLPLGGELAGRIASALNYETDTFGTMQGGDGNVLRALHRECRDNNENGSAFAVACRRICDAIPHHNSIDNLIDNHADEPRVAFCGKLAIAHQILAGERSSSLYISPSNTYNEIGFNRVANTWLPALFKMMQDGVSRTNVERFFENAAFITFNYDRCIEHYFYRALRKAYTLTEAQAAQIVGRASIQHVYGSVGALPWQTTTSLQHAAFGSEDVDLRTAAKSLRTYSEHNDDDAAMTGIRNTVQASEAVVFLGFGYLRTNLELLWPHNESDPTLVLGSTYGLSEFNISQVRDQLRGWYSNKLLSVDGVVLPHASTAKSLLDGYGRALV